MTGAPGAPSPNLAAAGGAGGTAAKGSAEDYASWGQYYSAQMTGKTLSSNLVNRDGASFFLRNCAVVSHVGFYTFQNPFDVAARSCPRRLAVVLSDSFISNY